MAISTLLLVTAFATAGEIAVARVFGGRLVAIAEDEGAGWPRLGSWAVGVDVRLDWIGAVRFWLGAAPPPASSRYHSVE